MEVRQETETSSESTFDPETGDVRKTESETTTTETSTETSTPSPDTRAPEEKPDSDQDQSQPTESGRDETAGGVFSPES